MGEMARKPQRETAVSPQTDQNAQSPERPIRPGDGEIPVAGARTGVADVQTSIERRRSPRTPLVVHVRYRTVDALFAEFSRNINEGGIFIETECPVGLGTLVDLEFELPGQGEPIGALGRVMRLENGNPRTGMAVEFEQLDPSARRRIDEFVRELRVVG